MCRCIVLVKSLWKDEELCVWIMRLKRVYTLTIELNDKSWLLTFTWAEREEILSSFHELSIDICIVFHFAEEETLSVIVTNESSHNNIIWTRLGSLKWKAEPPRTLAPLV